MRVEGPTGRAVVAVDGPREGKVGVVIGGGSGHEPAFAGYVGRGLADAAAVGNVFASPGPAQVADAARAADGGAGVVFLYGNYSGDVMNFDMAAEDLAADGLETRTVLVTDDVASAPPERAGERRGIAGGFFVFKVAGAAADAPPAALCEAMAGAFLDAVGASAGPLYATGLRRAGRAVAHRRDLDAGALAAWIGAMAEGAAGRGGARRQDDARRPGPGGRARA